MEYKGLRIILSISIPVILFVMAWKLISQDEGIFGSGKGWTLWLLYGVVVLYLELKLFFGNSDDKS